VAEEVEKVSPDLVARDDEGKPYSVRYDAVNAMLLNEFLKEHCKVEKLEVTVVQQQKKFQATISEQQREIQALTASLKEQASQIQKVSAELQVRESSPSVVLNYR
jgi:septal ring factor EnvC (AmiA/AmiB activator)